MTESELLRSPDIPLKETKPQFYELRGRLNRAEFACWATACLLLPNVLGEFGFLVVPITFFFYVLFIVKRLKDIDFSPWLVLIAWIPVLNFPLCLVPGDMDDNRFGEVPFASSRGIKVLSVCLPFLYTSIMLTSLMSVLPEFTETAHQYEVKTGNTFADQSTKKE
ncbi:DUF805 domain-containing protein [Vibrio sp. S9_S30]|uniref:DUF805 domain-containing protein n=1 Tax=Vibrio sp. S9_S30 TaxID=2720226 RepID=UPI0016806793|nr:DUF805 domain-containing protein [Vibrio sp. S9_S30]MBD1559448.1 DUF805 domain-containing protein [Vibrio sp. S9_S30]